MPLAGGSAVKLAIIMLAAIGSALPAFGDVVHLKSGGTLEGQVVETDDAVVVKLPVGEVRLSKDAVARIEKKETALEEYQKRAAALKDDDAEGHYRLGLWAQSVGLKAQAKEQFQKTIALKPDHAEAHKALGHRLANGQWVTEDQEMQARGLLKYDGQWMTPEAAARLQALRAELEVAREKRLAAEAELKKLQEQLKTQQKPEPNVPIYTPNPYDSYYSTRVFRSPTTYYWQAPYYIPYYTGPSFYWWHSPGGTHSYHHEHRR
jgi:hypothetical protein